jgi:hypothetical protein
MSGRCSSVREIAAELLNGRAADRGIFYIYISAI